MILLNTVFIGKVMIIIMKYIKTKDLQSLARCDKLILKKGVML